MKKEYVLTGAVFFLSLVVPLVAHAAPNIRIGATHDYLGDEKNTVVKRIRNSGDSTAFVRVSTVELILDANGKWLERESAASGQPGGNARPALIASPDRLIIPAGGMQVVRLLYAGERATERYFRVRFEPVQPSDKNGFDAEHADEYKQSVSAGINILTGYGSVLFAAPEKAHYATSVVRQDKKIVVRNDGNATVILHYFYECDAENRECVSLGKYHILPNTQRDFAMRDGYRYRFTLHEGGRERKMDFSS